MKKLRQILQFIRALLGFLLNLKKKESDEKKEKVATPDNQPGVAHLLPADTGSPSLVGGPYRNRRGLHRSVIDTLGVRAGRSLMLYAAGSCLARVVWG